MTRSFVRLDLTSSLLLAIAACAPKSGNLEQTIASNVTTVVADPEASATDAGHAAPIPVECTQPSGAEPKGTRRDEVCRRWRCESGDVTPARWNGNADACVAGTLDQDGADRALRSLNLYRYLADLAPVEAVSAWSGPAQQCALVAHANAHLSHTPERSSRCWSQTAYDASDASLIANRSAPSAIAAFLEDPGNETTMVHRRWLLSDTLSFVGLGSTDHYSCVIVDGRELGAPAPTASPRDGGAPRGWAMWPPAGSVPIELFTNERLDTSGWTLQSDADDLEDASLTVVSAGVELPVQLSRLEPLMGSRSAVRFVPVGWTTEAGRSYIVHVEGARLLELPVEPIDCAADVVH